TERSAAAATVAAMEPGERATAKALGRALEGVMREPDATPATAKVLGLAIQDVMREPDATPATAAQLFLDPLAPGELGKAQEAAAALEPMYAAGRLFAQDEGNAPGAL